MKIYSFCLEAPRNFEAIPPPDLKQLPTPILEGREGHSFHCCFSKYGIQKILLLMTMMFHFLLCCGLHWHKILLVFDTLARLILNQNS
jgi:hypothetical protein